MKTFKTIDCGVQFVLIVGFPLLYFFAIIIGRNPGQIMFGGYVCVGTWQIMSLIVHFFISEEYKVGLRKVYSVLLLITAILVLIGLFNTELLILILAGLLVWSPALAILYLVTCILELKKARIAF